MELRRANDQSDGPAIVFLPGIIMPAEFRYPALIRDLGGGVQAFTKELEVYDAERAGRSYSVDAEVAGLAAATDAARIDRFFLYGHSGGGAVALAFTAAYPERVLGLALDEPASDFSDETKAVWTKLLDPINALPESERMAAFMRVQVAREVELPAPPPGAPPPWMAARPAGVATFASAMSSYVLAAPVSAYTGPVYYSFGSQTNPIWREICSRLASSFPNFTSEEYEGLHHLNTSHAAEPARVARALRQVWSL